MSYIQKTADSIDQVTEIILGRFKNLMLETGRIIIFAQESLRLLMAKPSRFNEIVKHMEFIGNQSVGIIGLDRKSVV